MNNRSFLLTLVLAAMIFVTASGQGVGRRFPAEMMVIRDSVSGLPITVLTTDTANDSKLYQTHPQWTSDGNYIVFRSDRAGTGRRQAFAVDVHRGNIIQLTDDPAQGTGSLNLSRKKMELYYGVLRWVVQC